jgi:hypothetical protein
MPFLTAALLGAGIAAAGSIGGAALGANAAGNAASTQANASLAAAGIQEGDANAALNFNEQQLNLAQQNSATSRAAGQNATIALNDLMGLTPINPQPVNAGGNVAPQAGGVNGTATPGYINGASGLPGNYAPGVAYTPGSNADAVNPAYPGAPQAPNPNPPAPTGVDTMSGPMLPGPGTTLPFGYGAPGASTIIPRAKGGSTKIGLHYLVGERGPEELVMHPDGTGHVIPHVVSPRSALIPRAEGGPVAPGPSWTGPNMTATPQISYTGGPEIVPMQGTIAPGASTGGRPTGTGPAAPTSGTFNNSPYGSQSNNPLVTGGSPTPVQNTPFSQWTQQFVPPTGMPGQFQAPTLAQAEAQPGYQFALQQGEEALTNQASATGELLDPNTQRSLINYAQNAAEQDYGNVFNQNLSTNQQQLADYQQNYQNTLGQYQQAYNIFNQNQTNQYNRLGSIAGLGQTSTNNLNALGVNSAGNAGQVLTQSGQNIGQQVNNAAAATASGYVGTANAYGGALGNIGNSASNYLTMQQVMQAQQQQQQQNQAPIDQSWMPQNPIPGQAYYQ